MSYKWWQWAKWLYSVPLVFTGLIYLAYPQKSVETLTSFIPGGNTLIYIAGIFWVIFGLAIALNYYVRWAAWGIVWLISAYLVMVHVPAAYNGEYLPIVWFELLRDLSLMGSAFFLLAVEKTTQTLGKKVERQPSVY